MRKPLPLPSAVGQRFSVQDAVDAGVHPERLRRADLDRPFHGVRATRDGRQPQHPDPYERQAAERRIRIRQYAPRLKPGEFISHESAVALRGGPLPLIWEKRGAGDERPADGRTLLVHISTLGDGPIVRAMGVKGHRADPRIATTVVAGQLVVGSPATTFAQLGASLTLTELVAVGDFFCRVWRPGPGRRTVGRRPYATIDGLRATVDAARWGGVRRLRQAVDLIREDSWSPRETKLRLQILFSGLPEPRLNHDVYDEHGRFLGCVDLAYPEKKVAVEYNGTIHSTRYAADVERVARLRAAGWEIIEVTSATRTEDVLTRLRRALRR